MALALAAGIGFAQTGDKKTETVPQKPKVAGPADPMSKEQKDAVLKGLETVVTEKAFVPGVDFSKWPSFIEKRKEDIDKAEKVGDFAAAIQKALREFGTSHIRLMNPRAAAQRGQTSTVGAGIMVASDEKGLKVRRVADGSPSKTAGIEVGDVIAKVNGKKPEKSTDLEGDEGSKLKLEIVKASGDTKEVELELRKYSTVRKETLTWHGDDVAVLKIYTFAAGYGRDNLETLMGEAKKAKVLILDLRSNGGGATNNLNHLLSLFLKNGSDYGTFISRRIANDYTKANPTGELTAEKIAAWTKNKARTRERAVKPYEGKVGVLINRGSASASEICTMALREVGGAKVFGAKSAGAVLASVYARLPEGFSLQYPISDYVSIKGVRLEKNPIVPDEEISGAPSEDGKDPVIEKAIESLKKG